MVYAFTESEKKQIESCNMMVAEFKRILKMTKGLIRAIHQLYDNLVKVAEMIIKASYVIYEKVSKIVDDLKLAFEETREKNYYPTSRRYKIVKILSKCTGLEKREIWKMTQHTYLARSSC